MSKRKKRKWWVAGVMSFFVPGLGQIYNGQIGKGLAFSYVIGYILLFTCPALLIFFATLIGIPTPLNVIIPLLLWLHVHIDAIINAVKLGADYQLKGYNRWYVYLIYIACFVLLAFAIREFGVQAFRIASRGMDDAMLPGDFFLVHKYNYIPCPGDIICFKHPTEPQDDLISRCIAIGGQTVEIRNRIIYVDGKQLFEPYVKYLASGSTHDIFNSRVNWGPTTILPDHFFFIGDNRNYSSNSLDLGIPNQNLVHGHAIVVWWSWDSENRRVRWERIGKRVQ